MSATRADAEPRADARAMHDCRNAFADTLIALAETDPKVVAVCNDSVGSSKLEGFQRRWPERLINVGIAEQNLVGVGAGLANGGLLPFVCAAASFLTARALEQIKTDVAYSDANVKLCGISSGMAYGELGATHHSVEDFAWLRVIANLIVIAPADPEETRQAVRAAAAHRGPVFLRLSRMGVPDVVPEGYAFEIGRAFRLREGSDVTLVANGVLVHRALDAAAELEKEGLEARVLNVPTVRPLDEAEIIAAARDTGAVVTAEEHQVQGGLGGAVAEVVVSHEPVPMALLGVPGVFAPTGSAAYLLDRFGMSPSGIAQAATEVIRRKREGGP
jgi:transketolase